MPGILPPREPEPDAEQRSGYCVYCHGWASRGVPVEDGYVVHEHHAEDYRRWQEALLNRRRG